AWKPHRAPRDHGWSGAHCEHDPRNLRRARTIPRPRNSSCDRRAFGVRDPHRGRFCSFVSVVPEEARVGGSPFRYTTPRERLTDVQEAVCTCTVARGLRRISRFTNPRATVQPTEAQGLYGPRSSGRT